MMAALTAAEDKENSVLLLERQQRVGRKLLATGNGRCNLSNTELITNLRHILYVFRQDHKCIIINK